MPDIRTDERPRKKGKPPTKPLDSVIERLEVALHRTINPADPFNDVLRDCADKITFLRELLSEWADQECPSHSKFSKTCTHCVTWKELHL